MKKHSEIVEEEEAISDTSKDCSTRRKKFRKRTAYAPNKSAYLAYTANQHAKNRRLEIGMDYLVLKY